MRTLLAILFLSSFGLAADTVQPPKLPEPPRIVVTSGSAATTPAVPSLDVGRFVFLSLPSVDAPITYDVTGDQFVSIFVVKAGETYPGWRQGDTKAQAYKAPDSKSEVLMIFGEAVGTVHVACWGVKDGKPVKLAVTTLSVGGARPPPVPVPVPVDPVIPVPSTAPIAGDGFQVLIVYDPTAKVEAGQQSAINGKTVRDYLKSHCVTERPATTQDDGKAYRIWPVQEDYTGAPKKWQDAMARPHPNIPWIVVSDGKTGFEGPLPKSVDETLALLQKYGGK